MASGTPSAQVRIPVGDLVFPPPPTYARTILLREKICGGGVKTYPAAKKIIWGRNNYPGGRKWEKKSKKKSENCRTKPKIPYSISLYIEPNYTLS